MFSKTSPIGIIDSGVGGFSVAVRVRRLLPREHLLYLGDGANTPYGNHTEGEILSLTRRMLRFLRDSEIKALLVACNTISCLNDRFRDEMDCPVLGVMEAGAAAVQALGPDRVGVLSTCFTASSQRYPRLIARLSPNTRVYSRGSRDLAEVVERCIGTGREARIDRAIVENLTPLVREEGLTYCVLGCTHYALVRDRIHRLFPELTLIDPAERMARELRAHLSEGGLLNDGDGPGRLDIFTTGDAAEYRRTAEAVGLTPVTSVRSISL